MPVFAAHCLFDLPADVDTDGRGFVRSVACSVGYIAGRAAAVGGLVGNGSDRICGMFAGSVVGFARGGLTAWAALLFALAGQLRPEGHLLFALVVADGLVSMRWPQNSAENPSQSAISSSLC